MPRRTATRAGRIHAGCQTTCVQDRDTLRIARRFGNQLRRRREQVVDADHRREGGSARRLGSSVVARGDEVFDRARVVHRLHERDASNTVSAYTQDDGLVLSGGVEDLLDGRVAQQRGHPTVVGRRSTAALHVAEDRHASILARALLDRVCNQLRGQLVAVAVVGALGDENN